MSRRALSREVCQWLDWRGADGQLKQMSARVALKRLDEAGVIELPSAAPGATAQCEGGTGAESVCTLGVDVA